MNFEYRKKHINVMLNWSLDEKVAHAKKKIREFYDFKDGQLYIAFSGGKDSTVLLHLVRTLYPNVVAVFSNTTNEHTEILRFIKTVDNVITLKPKMTFKQVVSQYGFPLVSKETCAKIYEIKNTGSEKLRRKRLFGDDKGNGKLPDKWFFLIDAKFEVTNKCCYVLKKSPMQKFQRENNLFPVVGTTISESSLRRYSWLQYGCNILDSKDNSISRPISIFTEQDIWQYIKQNNLSYCSIYDDIEINGKIVKGEERTGCAYCAFGAHLEKSDLFTQNRFERLKLRKPKQYESMMRLENNGVTYREALTFIGVKS